MQPSRPVNGEEEDEAAFIDSFFLPGGILDPEDVNVPTDGPLLLPTMPRTSLSANPWEQNFPVPTEESSAIPAKSFLSQSSSGPLDIAVEDVLNGSYVARDSPTVPSSRSLSTDTTLELESTAPTDPPPPSNSSSFPASQQRLDYLSAAKKHEMATSVSDSSLRSASFDQVAALRPRKSPRQQTHRSPKITSPISPKQSSHAPNDQRPQNQDTNQQQWKETIPTNRRSRRQASKSPLMKPVAAPRDPPKLSFFRDPFEDLSTSHHSVSSQSENEDELSTLKALKKRTVVTTPTRVTTQRESQNKLPMKENSYSSRDSSDVVAIISALVADFVAFVKKYTSMIVRVLMVLCSMTIKSIHAVFWSQKLSEAIGSVYVVFFGCPMFCDLLMRYFSVPPMSPHFVSTMALYFVAHRSKARDRFRCTPISNKLCDRLLQVYRIYLPIGLILEGFDYYNIQVMLCSDTTRLMFAFVLCLIRLGQILSPVAWVSLSIQILISQGLPAGILAEYMVILIGATTIQLLERLRLHESNRLQ